MKESNPQSYIAWERPEVIQSFTRKSPSASLLEFVRTFSAGKTLRILDIGCGAGRHLRPLMEAGHDCTGTDVSDGMLNAAAGLLTGVSDNIRQRLHKAPMDALPFQNESFELIVCHGVWNLARTEHELRGAIAEAARVADSGSALYLTTFSRNTLPPEAAPVTGSDFIFTDFNNEPQTFLTSAQLNLELHEAGFVADLKHPVRELNRPAYWEKTSSTGLSIVGAKRPVLLEGVWIKR